MKEDESSIGILGEIPFPVAGTFIPKELHTLIDNSYGEIDENDYKFAVLELEDPMLDENVEGHARDEIVETDLDSTYVYVHIVQKLGSDVTSPLLQEFEVNDGTDDLLQVRAYHLYRFNHTKKSCNIKKEETLPSQKAAYKEINAILKEAWKQPEVEKRKMVKRLLLKWNPYKNSDNNELYTDIFQHIQESIYRLDKGLDLLDDAIDAKGDQSAERKFDFSHCEHFWVSSWFGRFWETLKRKRGCLVDKPYDEFDGEWGRKGTLFAEPQQLPYHYVAEARRWQKQAKSDLENSTLSLRRNPNNSFNWVCYMAHQAAEKSMKAAWYAKDANKIHTVRYSHNLNSIAAGLGSEIITLARRLSSMTGEHTRMRYPDAFHGQLVPEKAFSRQTAETVLSAAKQISEIVQKSYIN